MKDNKRNVLWSLLVAIALCFAFSSCHKGTVSIPKLTLKQKLEQKITLLSDVTELGTVEYTINKVVKAADEKEWYEFGDRKVLFNCTAYLKAGIDLQQFDIKDIEVNEKSKSAIVKLPKAKLLSFNMPPEKCVLVYEKVSTFRFNFTQADKNRLLQLGEQEIRQAVPDLGILQEAEHNATLFFNVLLKQIGFENITVKFV